MIQIFKNDSLPQFFALWTIVCPPQIWYAGVPSPYRMNDLWRNWAIIVKVTLFKTSKSVSCRTFLPKCTEKRIYWQCNWAHNGGGGWGILLCKVTDLVCALKSKSQMCFVLKTEYVIIWRVCVGVCVCVRMCAQTVPQNEAHDDAEYLSPLGGDLAVRS